MMTSDLPLCVFLLTEDPLKNNPHVEKLRLYVGSERHPKMPPELHDMNPNENLLTTMICIKAFNRDGTYFTYIPEQAFILVRENSLHLVDLNYKGYHILPLKGIDEIDFCGPSLKVYLDKMCYSIEDNIVINEENAQNLLKNGPLEIADRLLKLPKVSRVLDGIVPEGVKKGKIIGRFQSRGTLEQYPGKSFYPAINAMGTQACGPSTIGQKAYQPGQGGYSSHQIREKSPILRSKLNYRNAPSLSGHSPQSNRGACGFATGVHNTYGQQMEEPRGSGSAAFNAFRQPNELLAPAGRNTYRRSHMDNIIEEGSVDPFEQLSDSTYARAAKPHLPAETFPAQNAASSTVL